MPILKFSWLVGSCFIMSTQNIFSPKSQTSNMPIISVWYKTVFVAFMNFQVEYYGSPVSLKSIAQISTPDASSLLVQPYDKSRYSMCQLAQLNIFGNFLDMLVGAPSGTKQLHFFQISVILESRTGIKQQEKFSSIIS